MFGSHTFEDTPEGVKITITMSVKGPLGWLWRMLVAEDIVKELRVEMENQVKVAAGL